MPILTDIARRIRTSGPNPAVKSNGWNYPPWGGSLTPSGRTFDVTRVRTIDAVERAVSVIASPIANMPIDVYEKREIDGKRRGVQVELPRDAVIWGQPNPEVISVVFWETVLSHEMLRGNAYIFVVKDNAGRPLELWPIDPARVWVGRTSQGRKVYLVDNELPMVDFATGGEIVHVIGKSNDGVIGLSPLDLGAPTFEATLTGEEYASRLFSQDSTPRGILSSDQVLRPEQAEELAAAWEARHMGLANAHRVAVVGNGAKFQPISFNPEEAQALESRKLNMVNIARRFGVPPHLMFDVERSTSWGAGIIEQKQEFIDFCLNTHMTRFEQTIGKMLFGGQRQMKFNVNAFLRGDPVKRAQFYHYAVLDGWMSGNEVREKEDLPPYEGGDEFRAPLNMVPVGLESASLVGDERS